MEIAASHPINNTPNETSFPAGNGLLKINEWETKPEAQVWNAFREGNDEAFAYIYRKYVRLLLNYGCQIVANRELVLDAIQDTFEYLRKKRKKLGHTNSIKPYLYKSLRRAVLVKIKKNKEKVKAEQEACEGFQISLSHESILIDKQMNSEMIDSLERAFNKLPTGQKEAVLMYYYEGFSYEEIAGILEIKSVRNARKLIYRAVDNLKKEITFVGVISTLTAILFFLLR